MLPGDSLVPLESILCTEELNRRPSRAPDYQADKCALVALAQALADSPRTILQTMAEKMLEVFRCDSAGFSLLTKDGKSFYWPAIAGMWQPHIGGGTPRNFGPCGDVLDCNCPLLFSHWERRYPYLLAAMPLTEEGLLVPFYVEGKAVGTIWAIAHNDRRKFDAEDMRQLVSLGSFASSAYQVVAFLDALEERDEALRQSCEELEQRVAQRTSQLLAANEELEKRIAERKEAEEKLRRSEAFLAEGQRISHTGSWSWNVPSGKVAWSEENFRIFGFDPETTQPSLQLFLGTVHPKDRSFIERSLAEGVREKSGFDIEFRIALADGSIKHVHGVGRPILGESGEVDSYTGTTVDISERKRGEALFAGEKRLLEMIATGVPLNEILNVLCLIIEEYRRGTLASVLLLRPDGHHLDSVAGPTLLKAWTQQIENLPIGPCAGSCGTAAHRGSSVIVSDIATDPLWEVPEHRAAALKHGLRASWSNPILSSEGKVLGTFCIYDRETRNPNPHDLGLIEKATDLARVAIERDRAQASLRTSEEKYRDLINASPDAICVIDADGKCVLVNPAGVELAGRSEEELIGSSIADTYLPEERHLLEHRIDRLKAEGSLRFERKFVRKNGDVIPVEVSLSVLRGRYYQAIIRDISERKRAEEALRASEQVARGQVEALAQSLDVLATAPEPEKFIGQMLSTIGRLLKAQSVTLWLFDESTDSLILRSSTSDGGKLAAPDPEHPFIKNPLFWKENAVVQELLFTAGPVVCDDVETDPRVNGDWGEHLKRNGTKRFLAVPLLVGRRVRGFVGIRHVDRASYRPEEIELTQALAHQAMLAIQLNLFAEQSQQAAVLEERNRMARDMHDTLAQGFTGVIIQLEAAEDATSCGQQTAANKHLHRAAGLARRSLIEARRSVRALRPRALQEHNFWDALKNSIKNTTAGTALHTKFTIRGKLPTLPQAWQENLLHIGQEALTNTLKYAHARHFETRLTYKAKELHLELRDDGNGFKAKDRHDGVGLSGMRERVEQMGGQLKITSSRYKGTKVTVLLPCNGESTL